MTKKKTDDVITDAETEDLGPCMRKLTPLQRRFVFAMIQNPHDSQAQWAIAAGYKARNKQAFAAMGHVTAHSAKVVAGLQEFCRTHLTANGASLAIYNLIAAAKDRKNPRMSYDASLQILSRIGMGEKSEAKLTIEHTTDDSQMERLAMRLAAELRVDPSQLLGTAHLTSEQLAKVRPEMKLIEGKAEPVEVEAVEKRPPD
jgi:hypothetical protein